VRDPNLGEVLESYRRVLIPEVNLGQLVMLVRARFLVDAVGYNRVRGKPFRIAEIHAEAERILGLTTEPARVSDYSPNSVAGVD
jgi:2-oxoglutarate/2-oxoacid ferredoxin oxidoreductase subunit alpha